MRKSVQCLALAMSLLSTNARGEGNFVPLLDALSDASEWTVQDRMLLYWHCPAALRAESELMRREMRGNGDASDNQIERLIELNDRAEDTWLQTWLQEEDPTVSIIVFTESQKRRLIRSYFDAPPDAKVTGRFCSRLFRKN